MNFKLAGKSARDFIAFKIIDRRRPASNDKRKRRLSAEP
jgi:hypothetical protein